jgi:transcription initiation factor TFIIIB Brf1 subunit/transcription initiation factor TFIIB
MSEPKAAYPCPNCGSENIRYDYTKGQSECLICHNVLKADPKITGFPKKPYPCPRCGSNNVRYDYRIRQSECLNPDCKHKWKAEP